jgi:hypothetical protein
VAAGLGDRAADIKFVIRHRDTKSPAMFGEAFRAERSGSC